MLQKPIKILFLSSNPIDTARIRVDKEQREIDTQLRMSRSRDIFSFIDAEAVRTSDLQQALLDNEPQIIHFSGHGSDEGIILEDDDGLSQVVNAKALANLFKLFSDKIKCVVLNACYSDAQAIAIAKHIPYVIGMTNAIPDDAAMQFASGFYKAIGAGKSIEFAYEMGVNAIELKGVGADAVPKMLKSQTNLVLVDVVAINIDKEEDLAPVLPNIPIKPTSSVSPVAAPNPPATDMMRWGYIAAVVGGLLLTVVGSKSLLCSKKAVVDTTITTLKDSISSAKPTIKGVELAATIDKSISLPKGVYTIKQPTTVGYGVTLTLEAGAIIQFGQEAFLIVEKGGTLVALGTAAVPIIFRGESDADGFWNGIIVASNTKNNRLEYCKFKNGGNELLATVNIGVSNDSPGRLSMRNCEVEGSSSCGVAVRNISSLDNFENNTITKCKQFPIILTEHSVASVRANNMLTGNKRDFVAVACAYATYSTEDVVLEKLSVPYYMKGGELSEAINIGSNWIVKPGVHIVMGAGAALNIDGSNGRNGSFTALGTPDSPIVIDGDEHTKGFWDAIYMMSNSTKNILQHCKISDGGRTTFCCGGGNDKATGMIHIGETWLDKPATVNVANCSISNSAEAAIYYKKGISIVNIDIDKVNKFSNNTLGNVVLKQ